MQFHGNLEKTHSVGTNNLIKNGAYLTTSYRDILEKYPEFSNREKRNLCIKPSKIKIKPEYKDIYLCLTNEFFSIDEIAQMSGKNVREVINLLTLMEIEGLVIFKFGKGYKKRGG